MAQVGLVEVVGDDQRCCVHGVDVTVTVVMTTTIADTGGT